MVSSSSRLRSAPAGLQRVRRCVQRKCREPCAVKVDGCEMLHQFFKRSKCLTVWPMDDWRKIYGKPSFWPSIGDLERLAEVCAELNSWNILSRHHRHCEVLLAVWWCDPLQIGALTEDWRLKGAEIWTGTVGVATGQELTKTCKNHGVSHWVIITDIELSWIFHVNHTERIRKAISIS